MSDSQDCTQAAPRGLPLWVYRLGLVVATMIWGGNFVVAKPAVGELGSFWVIGIRFTCAALIMLALSFKHVKRHISKSAVRAGLIIGVFAFLGYGSQFLGLQGTTPSKNAFLSACYCVTTPFIWWLVSRRAPTRRNILCALLCTAGIALVSLQGEGGLSWGDGVSVLSAFLYGSEIVVIALLLLDNDIIVVTILELLVSGVLGCVCGFALGGAPSPQAIASPDMLWRLAYVTVLGSCFASTVQNVAQKHLPPAEIGLLCSLESVFGTIFSVVFYQESLTLKMLAGFVLIFCSLIICTLPAKQGKREEARAG